MKVYCGECYYYDNEPGYGTDCMHPTNKRRHIKDTYREKQYGYMWSCYTKNMSDDCELYLSDKAESDRKCIFRWMGRKIRGE